MKSKQPVRSAKKRPLTAASDDAARITRPAGPHAAGRPNDAIRRLVGGVNPDRTQSPLQFGVYSRAPRCKQWTGTALFHTKRLVTKFTTKRVQLLDKWNNIGAPVITYYTDEQLMRMIGELPGARIADVPVEDANVNFPWRMAGIRRRINTTTIIIQKSSA